MWGWTSCVGRNWEGLGEEGRTGVETARGGNNGETQSAKEEKETTTVESRTGVKAVVTADTRGSERRHQVMLHRQN